MRRGVAWAILALGIIHIVFGVLRFREPLLEALAAGFVGQFREPEIRRTAFWFIMCGPLLMLIGHMAIRAVSTGNYLVLKLIGIYALVASVIGIMAYPVSPLWILFLLSILLIVSAGRPISGRS